MLGLKPWCGRRCVATVNVLDTVGSGEAVAEPRSGSSGAQVRSRGAWRRGGRRLAQSRLTRRRGRTCVGWPHERAGVLAQSARVCYARAVLWPPCWRPSRSSPYCPVASSRGKAFVLISSRTIEPL
ncbi:hypothetical protein K1T71_001626 [Dendrolimus kikuchii]|uniref:Uncharacterized protein n=1 Tax=Dendrolimus kikuchii TaxID=765133 RepID=A0ACC1DFQ4_9NEOP|nr:hypothetical protein K1T71_001626 [Dendrolimus kikuchii]